MIGKRAPSPAARPLAARRQADEASAAVPGNRHQYSLVVRFLSSLTYFKSPVELRSTVQAEAHTYLAYAA